MMAEEPTGGPHTTKALKDARADLMRLFERAEHEGRKAIDECASSGTLGRVEAQQVLNHFLDRLEERMAVAERQLATRLLRLAERLPAEVSEQAIEKLDQTVEGLRRQLHSLPASPHRGPEGGA